eukprot:TRINITY_DN4744_c0_g1_i1.p1 TRINITY_DN4744_c0_g1~~TRINITY_DN4744_c0_g1_i1.p1  ORF type:complete len:241 (+),score=65.88 TRINITY_DN4744_c0_g1_i1:72-794(+)
MDVGPAKEYLMNHNVHLLFETLAAELIGQRPGAPLDYLIQRLQEMRAQRGDTKPKVVFVLGGPGSGKGTQCQKLVAEKGFIHVSAGDLLREEVKSGSERGVQINECIKNGQIVPGHITIELLGKAIAEQTKGPETTFLIDGFPRELGQALNFSKDVCEPTMVLNYTCPDKELERRLLHRGQFSGRSDDNLEAIKKRLKVFHKQTEPVIAYFEALCPDKVKSIDATRPIEEILNDSLKCFL